MGQHLLRNASQKKPVQPGKPPGAHDHQVRPNLAGRGQNFNGGVSFGQPTPGPGPTPGGKPSPSPSGQPTPDPGPGKSPEAPNPDKAGTPAPPPGETPPPAKPEAEPAKDE